MGEVTFIPCYAYPSPEEIAEALARAGWEALEVCDGGQVAMRREPSPSCQGDELPP